MEISVGEQVLNAVKLFEKKGKFDWEYDEEADVLYLSFGKPRKAVGIDIGEGVVVRYDEQRREVVGLTILGIRSKLGQHLGKRS